MSMCVAASHLNDVQSHLNLVYFGPNATNAVISNCSMYFPDIHIFETALSFGGYRTGVRREHDLPISDIPNRFFFWPQQSLFASQDLNLAQFLPGNCLFAREPVRGTRPRLGTHKWPIGLDLVVSFGQRHSSTFLTLKRCRSRYARCHEL